MLRYLILSIAVALTLSAAALPEQFGPYRRGAVAPIQPDDRSVWDEYGLELAEKADYTGAGQNFSISAFRMSDTTGAFAAAQWQNLKLHDNYVFRIEGGKPQDTALSELYGKLPKRSSTALPPLYAYLPTKGRVPSSERYMLGPQSLLRFEPRIPSETAGFDRGAEAQSARYKLGGREFQLTILAYPTPQMAIERFRHFQRIEGAALRRSGTMISVIPEAQDIATAVKLIEQVNYNPKLTWNEYVPKATVQDAANMILAISVLAGGLIIASLIMGIFIGGGKVLARHLGLKPPAEEFTSLHIGN
ncbi:MAG: hypothetical protein H7Y20_08415 [Bryobacteraceae bacterium]|nr:hypothetical protein [Bryobacteraceae bacterium]